MGYFYADEKKALEDIEELVKSTNLSYVQMFTQQEAIEFFKLVELRKIVEALEDISMWGIDCRIKRAKEKEDE